MSKLKRKQNVLHKAVSALTKDRYRIVRSEKWKEEGGTPENRQKSSVAQTYHNVRTSKEQTHFGRKDNVSWKHPFKRKYHHIPSEQEYTRNVDADEMVQPDKAETDDHFHKPQTIDPLSFVDDDELIDPLSFVDDDELILPIPDGYISEPHTMEQGVTPTPEEHTPEPYAMEQDVTPTPEEHIAEPTPTEQDVPLIPEERGTPEEEMAFQQWLHPAAKRETDDTPEPPEQETSQKPVRSTQTRKPEQMQEEPDHDETDPRTGSKPVYSHFKKKKRIKFARNDPALKQYGWLGTQFQFRLTRTKFSDGKYRRVVTLERGKRRYHNRNGLLHSIYYERERIVGDKPSITKSLQSWKPVSKRGKLVKGAAVTTNYLVHENVKGIIDVALGSETAAMETGKYTVKTAAEQIKQKYRSNASDDMHRGTLFVARSALDAGRGVYQHFRMRSQYKGEIEQYKLRKQERKELREKYTALKADRKADKQELSRNKKQYKQEKGQERRQAKAEGRKYTPTQNEIAFQKKYQDQKQKYRYTKGMTQVKKKELKIKTQQKRTQNHIRRLSAPNPLVLQPIAYYGKQMRASAWQKAVSEDENNDFMQVVDFGKEHIVDKVIQKNTPYHRLKKQEIRRDRLFDKNAKKQAKLQLKENKLQNSRTAAHSKPKRKFKKQKSTTIAQHLKDFFQDPLRSKIASKGKAVAAIVTLSLSSFCTLLFMILSAFSSLFSGSGYVMGTFPSQDYYLTQAEEYYTKLAWDLNEQILRINADHWKDALKELDVDTSGMKDKPNEFIWGNSSVLPYDPAYDFDIYKLWSFLCAYYYEYDEEKQDMKYWEYDSGTESVLKALFDDEYEFLYHYDNGSRWEELSNYVYFGGGNSTNGTYYYCESTAIKSSGAWQYRFKPISYTSELGQYLDSDGYCYINSSYRVLDPNDDYELTGYFILNNRYFADGGHTVEPFYWYDGNGGYYFKNHDGNSQYRSFYRWDNGADDAWFMITEPDARAWTGNSNCSALFGYVQKLEWKTDCRLYYTVHQKKTFDEVIEEKLRSFEDGDERLQYYHLLVGDDSKNLFGNHQIFRDMFGNEGNSIQNKVSAGELKNSYGWDVHGWNSSHCSLDALHEGIDIACSANTILYAPMDCVVESYDAGKHMIVLKQNKVHFWYDGDGKGKDRDTEITIGNADLISGIEVGDTLTTKQEFASSSSRQYCDDKENLIGDYVHIKVKIDTDGIGWDYVDPLLVFF